MIKSTKMRWVRDIECMGTTINACKIYLKKPKRKSHLKDGGSARRKAYNYTQNNTNTI
jgi:hypothetical protein